eukprot:11645119-Karenia_brevis.AAC.1
MSTRVTIDYHCHLHVCRIAFQNFEAGLKSSTTIKQLSNKIFEHNYKIIVTFASDLKKLPSQWSGCQNGLPSHGSGLQKGLPSHGSGFQKGCIASKRRQLPNSFSNVPPSGGFLIGPPPSG